MDQSLSQALILRDDKKEFTVSVGQSAYSTWTQ